VQSDPSVPALPDGADVLGDQLRSQLLDLSLFVSPHAPTLERRFHRLLSGRFDPGERKALSEITPGAAMTRFASGREPADFFEQVAYSGRRLAKLNIPPGEIVKALKEYDGLLEPLLARLLPGRHREFQWVRDQLQFCVLLTLNNAFYQVREEESRAFFELFRAEVEAASLDDMLERFLKILVRTFRASAGRLILVPAGDREPGKEWRRKASRPLFLEAVRGNGGVLDGELAKGGFASYWSIPHFAHGKLAAVVQFGFPTRYRWLPRELQLLDAAGERFLLATEKARLIEDLKAREAQVRKLSEHLLRVEEEERRRISRELHDEAGQAMLCIRLQLEMIEKTLPPDLRKVRESLASTREVTEGVIVEIRRIIGDLSPAVLEQLGLAAALKQLARRFRAYSPARIRLQVTGGMQSGAVRLSRETEIVTYRLVQECLNNVAKHASASTVNIRLRSADSLVVLSVEDDGVGFDPAAAAKKLNSFGLAGIRERVGLLGGRLTVASRPGKGTKISIELPISK
jgi:signal transduction histidine kinase